MFFAAPEHGCVLAEKLGREKNLLPVKTAWTLKEARLIPSVSRARAAAAKL
jgi:hypothetical protein